jgi:xylose isomerase
MEKYFDNIDNIAFEGVDSDNPLAFKYYDPKLKVAGKTLKEHLRFSLAYWHSLCGTGGDPFGMATKQFPWLNSKDPIQRAKDKMDAAFEFMEKMGLEFYCFHDFDLIDEGKDLKESEKRLETISDHAKDHMERSGIQLLWGTANLFSHPRYMNGAATNPDFRILAHATAQVKNALDVTMKLDGQNYVFWGGREGYMSLLNTDMKREQEHLARFLHNAKDYARSQGFEGNFFIEPKPMEPSKHQYDFDAETVIGFLRFYGLDQDFKLNIEVNHATLANHTFQHELQAAANANMLGSIDANRGDYQNGWDTDQFPNNVYEIAEAYLVILQAGGIQGGGVNFDAKTRRNSTDLEDLFIAHIGGMDVFARGLIIADRILNQSDYKERVSERYSSFDTEQGKAFEKGALKMTDLANIAIDQGEIEMISGKQEYYENLINNYLY